MPICLYLKKTNSVQSIFAADLANGEPATEANTDMYKK